MYHTMKKLLPFLVIPLLLLAGVARADQAEELEQVLAVLDQQIAALEYALKQETDSEKQESLRVQLTAAKDNRANLHAQLEAEVAKRAAHAKRHASDLVHLSHEVNLVLARISVETRLVGEIADRLDPIRLELESAGRDVEAAKIDKWLDGLDEAESMVAEGRTRFTEIQRTEGSRGHAENVGLYHALLGQLNEALERMRLLRVHKRPQVDVGPSPAEVRREAEALRKRARVERTRLEAAVDEYALARAKLSEEGKGEEADKVQAELESITDSLAVLRKAHEKLEKVVLKWAYQPDEKHGQDLAEAVAEVKQALQHLWQDRAKADAAARQQARIDERAAMAAHLLKMLNEVRDRVQRLRAKLLAERARLAERLADRHPEMLLNQKGVLQTETHLAELEHARSRLEEAKMQGTIYERFAVADEGFREVRALIEATRDALGRPEPGDLPAEFATDRHLIVEGEIEVEVEDDLPYEESRPDLIDHLRRAAHHLREAGQHEAAEKVEAEIRRLAQHRDHPVAVHEAIRDLRREVRALRKEVRELRELLLEGRDR